MLTITVALATPFSTPPGRSYQLRLSSEPCSVITGAVVAAVNVSGLAGVVGAAGIVQGMALTPVEAFQAARRYLAEYRPESRFIGLLENNRDYLVLWEQDVEVLGEGPILLSKRTEQFRVEASALGGTVADGMTPVKV